MDCDILDAEQGVHQRIAQLTERSSNLMPTFSSLQDREYFRQSSSVKAPMVFSGSDTAFRLQVQILEMALAEAGRRVAATSRCAAIQFERFLPYCQTPICQWCPNTRLACCAAAHSHICAFCLGSSQTIPSTGEGVQASGPACP